MPAPTLVIPLGVSGLAASDFSFRFYLSNVAYPAYAAALTVTELTAGDYRVNNLPDAAWATLTWEYPGGGAGNFAYSNESGAPPYVVIPVRDTGLVAADLGLALYLDGVERADTLTVAEIGLPGDYSVTGWATDTPGTWLLVYHYGGVAYYQSWTVPVVAAAPGFSITDDLADLFDSTVRVQPGIVDEWGKFVASGTELSLPCRIEGEQRTLRDSAGNQITSSMLVIVGGYNYLTTDLHRYYLPSRFSPNGTEGDAIGLKAVYVDKSDDDVGTCYEEISLP